MATQQRRQSDVIIIIKSSVVKAIHKNIAGEGKGGGGRVGVLMKGQGKNGCKGGGGEMVLCLVTDYKLS